MNKQRQPEQNKHGKASSWLKGMAAILITAAIISAAGSVIKTSEVSNKNESEIIDIKLDVKKHDTKLEEIIGIKKDVEYLVNFMDFLHPEYAKIIKGGR